MHSCPFCGRRFRSLRGLVAHLKLVHLDEKACPCCGARVRSILDHLKFHALRDACHRRLAMLMLARDSKVRMLVSNPVLYARRLLSKNGFEDAERRDAQRHYDYGDD